VGDTRQAILRAARDLFMAEGYRAVSTRQIATACGLTQPALYRHFGDKQELYVAVLEAELETMRLGLERILARSTDVGERLRQVIRFMPASRQDLPQMFHDIAHELDQAARQRLQEAFERCMVAPVAAVFADGMRQGTLRGVAQGGVPPVAAAFLLLGMLQHPAGGQGATERGGPTFEERYATLIVGMILHGLQAPGVGTASADVPSSDV
jgi:AcrR family transcriptional regulator